MKNLGAIRQEVRGIAAFLAAIWGVFLVDRVLCYWQVNLGQFGLRPWSWWGLLGILTMPFLHGGFVHVLGNTISLGILLLLLAGSQSRTWIVVVAIALLGGVLLWAVGRSATHMGSDALVFGLVTFLLFSGFLEKRVIPILVSILVGILYGGRLIVEVFPLTAATRATWDDHLCGALAGVAIAFIMTRFHPRPPDKASGGR
jgi:membrane associated rhomboid family serine protease